jgi:17beta-estradiol 17-dehydrogenase / very-long-chain 3-oxoacyl-CoA reductase
LLDYANPEEGIFEKLGERVSRLSVTVLVNNAGVSHELPTPFAEERPAVIDAIVQVNCLSTAQVTRAVLPGMLSRKLGGLILNMGSVSAELKTPLLQTYAGSKAFLRTWSEALAVEVARDRIHVELLNTHFVTTNMSKIRRSSFTCPTPREYVMAVLSRCGSAPLSTLHPGHALVYGVMSVIPEWILKPAVLKQMLATRKHALSKASKAK